MEKEPFIKKLTDEFEVVIKGLEIAKERLTKLKKRWLDFRFKIHIEKQFLERINPKLEKLEKEFKIKLNDVLEKEKNVFIELKGGQKDKNDR